MPTGFSLQPCSRGGRRAWREEPGALLRLSGCRPGLMGECISLPLYQPLSGPILISFLPLGSSHHTSHYLVPLPTVASKPHQPFWFGFQEGGGAPWSGPGQLARYNSTRRLREGWEGLLGLGLLFWGALGGKVKWSEVIQSCPTLCDPMDCSLPGSPIHGIFQARVLEVKSWWNFMLECSLDFCKAPDEMLQVLTVKLKKYGQVDGGLSGLKKYSWFTTLC